MNRNATPLILIVLSLGIYFTFTRLQIEQSKTIGMVNDQYKKAIEDSKTLIIKRDSILATYNKISPEDQLRLGKMVPDNVDNVRLVIDVNGVASRHGISIKNVKTSTTKDQVSSSNNPNNPGATNVAGPGGNDYDTVTLSFDTTGGYRVFQDFLKDLESSLRILEISKISLKANDTSNYDYSLEIKTYWLKK